MQRFEITLDGVAQPNDFATREEAEAALITLKEKRTGKALEIRTKVASAPESAHAEEPAPVVATIDGSTQVSPVGRPRTNPPPQR